MATMTFVIPDESAARIAAAVCAASGHTPTSPQDAMQFTKDYVFNQLRQIVLEQEAEAAANAVMNNPSDPLVNAVLS